MYTVFYLFIYFNFLRITEPSYPPAKFIFKQTKSLYQFQIPQACPMLKPKPMPLLPYGLIKSAIMFKLLHGPTAFLPVQV